MKYHCFSFSSSSSSSSSGVIRRNNNNDGDSNKNSVSNSLVVPSSSSSTCIHNQHAPPTTDLINITKQTTTTTTITSMKSLSTRSINNLRVFTLAHLKTATNNFSRSLFIGEGGFGCVYKGCLHDSNIIHIAVKQLSRTGFQGHKEWVTEVNVLGVVEHPNLVKLIGYCAEDDERGIQRLLVYEYMPKNSVQHHLSNPRRLTGTTTTPTLPWDTRLRIAQDAARGLAYLHQGMDFQIIFRDFKSSNILLDDHWNAKLSDFGLARLGPLEGLTHVSTAIVGTVGYAAPEYVQTGRLTSKSDVWSYGVFLYELITGRRPLDPNRPKKEQKLLDWVRQHLSDMNKFQLIIDPQLHGRYSPKSAQKLAAVANMCLVRHPKLRPNMTKVLEMINHIVEETNPVGNPTSLTLEDDYGETVNVGFRRRFKDSFSSEKGRWFCQPWRPKSL